MAGIPGCRSRFLHQLGTGLFLILPPPPYFFNGNNLQNFAILFVYFLSGRKCKNTLPLPGGQKNTRPAFYGRPCVPRPYAVLSEKAHLAAFRQVAQSAHLTQAVDDAAAHAGGLLQLLDGEVLLPMEGGVFQRIGGGTAQTFQ